MNNLETLSIIDLQSYLNTENLDILKNFKTELDDIYSEYFGFTEHEIIMLLEKGFNVSNNLLKSRALLKIKDWSDGYTIDYLIL